MRSYFNIPFYFITVVFLVFEIVPAPVLAQTNSRSLNTQVRYNTRTTERVYVYPDENELRVTNRTAAYRGSFVKWEGDSLIFNHLTITKRFDRKDIISMSQTPKPYFSLNKDHNSYLDNNVQMFVSPTAQTLEAGRVNVSSHYLLFYQGVVGITDKFQMGVGFTLIPDLDNQSPGTNVNGQFFSISTKLKLRDRKHMDLAIGSVHMRTPSTFLNLNFTDNHLIHYFYVAGSADYSIINLTASIGQPYFRSISSKQLFSGDPRIFRYITSVAGSVLLSEQISIISESWWFNGIYNTPGVTNVNRKGIPDVALLGGRYYTDMYGGGIGIGNFLIPGINLWDAIYIDGYYYF